MVLVPLACLYFSCQLPSNSFCISYLALQALISVMFLCLCTREMCTDKNEDNFCKENKQKNPKPKPQNIFRNNLLCSLDTAEEWTHSYFTSSSMCNIEQGLSQSDRLWNISNICAPKGKKGRTGIRPGLGMCFPSPFFPPFLFISCFLLLHSYGVLHTLQYRCALKNGLHNSQFQFKWK